MWDFVYKYYVEPIIYDTGYNPVNTITWAIILGLSLLLIYKLLKRLNITIDDTFILSLIPYVVLGSMLRVVEDLGAVSPPLSYLLITPLIYFLIFALALLPLKLYKKDPKLFAGVGILYDFIALIPLSQGHVERMWVIPTVILVGSLVFAGVYVMFKLLLKDHIIALTNINLAVLWCHMVDATSTYVGVDVLGYVEKHVVPRALIGITDTALVMYPLKLLVLIPALYLIDREKSEIKNIVKLAIIVLGLAPAIRNSLRMTLGV